MRKLRGNPPRITEGDNARRRIVVDIDADLHRRLVEARQATGRAIARLAVDAIEAYLSDHRPERLEIAREVPPENAA